MATVPATVQDPELRESYAFANNNRADIKTVAANVKQLADQLKGQTQNGEAIANALLAYRHLEDASMRLGKVLQHLDGGVSVYDRETTVGA